MMDDIHSPTVPSGPTSNGVPNGVAIEKLTFRELVAEKERIEGELSALSSVLDSHGANMDTSLTTFDGFPRADIDVAQIRTTRARIIRIRNDYKAVMNRIEEEVHAHFAEAADQSDGTGLTETATSIPGPSHSNDEVPFAKVNSVVSGSPADRAGLKAGDQIIRFGTADWMNHDKLTKVSEVVIQNEGRPIVVIITREASSGTAEKAQLSLTPRRDWGGRGMLGCHLLPL